ncbi:Predicted endonuclease containing a URI domain [Chryseobacterium nakagawai]|uniref:GIY-YIG nuclease family protein n=1 Tax=Chryseobacterium nakagawai TaxID=1241982 RepID=UPI000F6CADC8|nr:GIY-YIG nuclease family protein [Chryseobacterium nakagawai]VEH21926.1 Predicted endonuclease containing a URI domain [Chryseobacterium nakagawai]
MSNDLKNRLYWHQHPEAIDKSFTSKYKCFYLIYFEHFDVIETAIAREKQIKGWTREKKENLITEFNSDWKFLNEEVE